jgi:uncharacterized membrane protein YsdA (DUF1294 family)
MIWFMLTSMNCLAFWLYWYDKRQAATGGWRVPESQLLSVAIFGGWFGAKVAQRQFRHKNRKEPFRTQLNLIPFLWAAFLVFFIWNSPRTTMRLLKILLWR